MKGIVIHNPGLLATIQDEGRYGYRQYGMPVSGAMDQLSMRCANWLVGNDLSEAVIECTVVGPKIEFLHGCRIAITGADSAPELNGDHISQWETIFVNKNDTLEFENFKDGSRIYLAISGGFKLETTMGSNSTYMPSSVGGFNGRNLRQGDIIPVYPTLSISFRPREIPPDLIPDFSNTSELFVLPGIDWNDFPDESKSSFFNNIFTVSPESNRMGYRLTGDPILASKNEEILSRAVAFGFIQITGEGQPIIMGADCQTTGGYRHFISVISAQHHILGQLMPGDKLSFNLTDINYALKKLKEMEENYSSLFRIGRKGVCTDCVVYRR